MAISNTTGIFASAATAVDSQSASTQRPAAAELTDKSTFLRLLVAQLRNQNPLQPADGMQYVAQLAQFSQLEQLISIREALTVLHAPSDTANQNVDPSQAASGPAETQK